MLGIKPRGRSGTGGRGEWGARGERGIAGPIGEMTYDALKRKVEDLEGKIGDWSIKDDGKLE